MTTTVELADAGVQFQFDRQRRLLSPTLARIRRGGRTVWALRHVDLSVAAGEGVAVVGRTGSGKSTLLRLLGGVLEADEGATTVTGRVGALLATEAGLIAPLTGRENSELLGVLHGMSGRAAHAAVARVRAVSELGDAFELPVASYSHGMRARLGFAVIAQREIDVLLLDEVHEAIDHEFRAFVVERAEAIRRRGGIVIAAGHNHDALAEMCERAVLLDTGSVTADGRFDEVVDAYAAQPAARS